MRIVKKLLFLFLSLPVSLIIFYALAVSIWEIPVSEAWPNSIHQFINRTFGGLMIVGWASSMIGYALAYLKYQKNYGRVLLSMIIFGANTAFWICSCGFLAILGRWNFSSSDIGGVLFLGLLGTAVTFFLVAIIRTKEIPCLQ